MNNKIKYLFASLFIFLYNTFVFANDDVDLGGGFTSEDGGGTNRSSQGEGAQGTPENPIDMYEGVLLLVAVSLIVGYYLYKRNKRIA